MGNAVRAFYVKQALEMAGADLFEGLNANSMFMVQMVIAACIGGLEFCFPALFVDTFNTFEVYTSHRLYGATMIVNAIIVYAMRQTNDIHRVKKEVVQAFLFQFGLHIIVLLRPQVWGFLTAFNKVNLLCSFGLAAAYGYILMGDKRRISSGFKAQDNLELKEKNNARLREELAQEKSNSRSLQEQNRTLKADLESERRKNASKAH